MLSNITDSELQVNISFLCSPYIIPLSVGLCAGKFEDIDSPALTSFFQPTTTSTADVFGEVSSPSKPPTRNAAGKSDRGIKSFLSSTQRVDPFDSLENPSPPPANTIRSYFPNKSPGVLCKRSRRSNLQGESSISKTQLFADDSEWTEESSGIFVYDPHSIDADILDDTADDDEWAVTAGSDMEPAVIGTGTNCDSDKTLSESTHSQSNVASAATLSAIPCHSPPSEILGMHTPVKQVPHKRENVLEDLIELWTDDGNGDDEGLSGTSVISPVCLVSDDSSSDDGVSFFEAAEQEETLTRRLTNHTNADVSSAGLTAYMTSVSASAAKPRVYSVSRADQVRIAAPRKSNHSQHITESVERKQIFGCNDCSTNRTARNLNSATDYERSIKSVATSPSVNRKGASVGVIAHRCSFQKSPANKTVESQMAPPGQQSSKKSTCESRGTTVSPFQRHPDTLVLLDSTEDSENEDGHDISIVWQSERSSSSSGWKGEIGLLVEWLL